MIKAFGYIILIALLFSCSGGNKVQNGRLIQKRKYTKGFYFSSKPKQKPTQVPDQKAISQDHSKFTLRNKFVQKDDEISEKSFQTETKIEEVAFSKNTVGSEPNKEPIEVISNENLELSTANNNALNSKEKLTLKPYPWEVRDSIKVGLIIGLSLLGLAVLLPFGLLFFKGTGIHFIAYWFFVILGTVNIIFFVSLGFYWAIFIGIILIILAFLIMLKGYFMRKPQGY